MKIVASILKSNPFSTNSREVQLLWLYAVALILSVWLIADVNVQYANDSLHYMRAGELFLNGHIHDFRTPLYPIIFHLAQVITGRFAGEAVVILQIVLYLLSILAFYNIGRSLIKSPAILFTISLLYATHPGLILWNYFILTESLAISGAVILFYLILEFYKKPTLLLAIAIPATILALIALRPSSIYFTPALATLTLYMLAKKQKFAWTLFSGLFIAVIAVAAYCYAFKQQYGIFTPSHVSILNKYYFVRKANLITPADAPTAQMQEFVLNILSDNENDQYIEFTQLIDKFGHKKTDCLIKNTINRERSRYISFIITQITGIRSFPAFSHFVDTATVSIPCKAYIRGSFFLLMFHFNFVYLFIIGYTIAIAYSFYKKKSIPFIPILLLMTIACNLAIIVSGAISEWHRLFAPTMPLFFIMLATVADRLRIKAE